MPILIIFVDCLCRTYGFILTIQDLSPNIGVLWYDLVKVKLLLLLFGLLLLLFCLCMSCGI